MPAEKILCRHFEKYPYAICSYNLQKILEIPFPFFISQKPGEMQIFRTFLEKFSIFAFISKNGYFELRDEYDVTSWDVGTYFGMYGKCRPLAILWYQLHVSGGFIFKFTGVVTTPPLVRRVTKKKKKKLGKPRVNQISFSTVVLTEYFTPRRCLTHIILKEK